MNEKGIDISHYTRTLLDKSQLDEYDVIVSMAQKEYTPDWLTRLSKYTYWDITDPRGQDLEHTRKVRDEIESKIETLVQDR